MLQNEHKKHNPEIKGHNRPVDNTTTMWKTYSNDTVRTADWE